MSDFSVVKTAVGVLRQIAARLPRHWQTELKRIHFRRRIRRGTFISDEPEFSMLSRVVACGDWVVDIGANVGFYTKRLAELVGPEGRVLAFEPVPETFVLLASNLDCCRLSNVTLFNAAVSETTGVVGMSIPEYSDTGQRNYYQAHLTSPADSELRILTVSLDSIEIPTTVRLIKIDAEGHEFSVLKGMRKTLLRDHPILIVEAPRTEVWDFLESLSYVGSTLPGSPNVVFHRGDLRWEELERR
jgi:FkbM family methyltransferase